MTFLIFEFLNMVLHIVMIIYNYIYIPVVLNEVLVCILAILCLSFVFEMYIAV